MQNDTLDSLIKAVDPVRGKSTVDLDARARADLATILRSERPSPKSRKPLALIAAAASVVLVAGVVLAQPWVDVKPGPGTAYAATPPLVLSPAMGKQRAGSQLDALAKTVAALPAETPTGPILKVTTRGWYLVTTVRAESTDSKLEPSTVTTYIGNGETVSGEDPDVRSATPWPEELSSDPTVLRRQLAAGHGGNDVDALFRAIADLYRTAAPQPAVRAAVLRILAKQPELRAEGEVTDRLGRRGLGFSALLTGGGLPTKTTLVFTPTGDLLTREEMLTKTAGKLNVPIPSVISYVLYTNHEYVTAFPR